MTDFNRLAMLTAMETQKARIGTTEQVAERKRLADEKIINESELFTKFAREVADLALNGVTIDGKPLTAYRINTTYTFPLVPPFMVQFSVGHDDVVSAYCVRKLIGWTKGASMLEAKTADEFFSQKAIHTSDFDELMHFTYFQLASEADYNAAV